MVGRGGDGGVGRGVVVDVGGVGGGGGGGWLPAWLRDAWNGAPVRRARPGACLPRGDHSKGVFCLREFFSPRKVSQNVSQELWVREWVCESSFSFLSTLDRNIKKRV